MPMNDWIPGTLYDPHWNNVHWTQPSGPYTKVLPVTQVQAQSNLLTTEPFSELTGVFIFPCGHSVNMVQVFQDYDYINETSVALIACPTCSCISRVVEPYSAIQNPLTFAIITP
jgi:hypothetical protein